MRISVVSLAVLFVFLFLSPRGGRGQDIQLSKAINIDPDADLKVTPMSFCGTGDNLFLLPDHKAGTIKVFNKEGNYLKFIKEFDSDGFGAEEMKQPMFCCYSRDRGLFGVFDYRTRTDERRVFIFKRGPGKVDFRLIEIFPCPGGAYDLAFAKNGDVVVSGYVPDKKGNPFDLYRIRLKTGQIDYILPSPQKYGLETYEQYLAEYYVKQTIPAQGTQAFIDIYDSNLAFVWEASELRIIKIDLQKQNKKRGNFSGKLTPAYTETKPDLPKMAAFYKKGNFEEAFEEQKKKAYVRNIFATKDHLFLIYETDRNDNASTFRVQKYSQDGNFLGDFLIPGSPGPLWFDAENYELYAFSKKSQVNKEPSILKYKINR
jgi:hypothetical protein